jgi:SseB protein N-terminal domain/SseB protein C-terminal domain
MTMPTSSGPQGGLRLHADGRVPRARCSVQHDTAGTDATSASDDAVVRALEAAIKDSDRLPDLLDVLSDGRLWVPLPDDGTPVTDGSSLTLPIVTYLGGEFVPAFTSSRELSAFMADPGQDTPPAVVPHVVVPAADLARSLPPDLGIALNPGAEASVPVYPAGVAYLAAVQGQAEGVRIRVGNPPRHPTRLLSETSAQLRTVPDVREARSAWLSVAGRGEGLIISIDLDNPADQAAQDAAAQAVERAAALVTEDAGFPIDVLFAGEAEPNPVAESVAASAAPFYLRA